MLRHDLTGALVRGVGVYSDLAYRIPSVAGALGAAVVVYLMGCRWRGRRVGLLAAALWAGNPYTGYLTYLCGGEMLTALGVLMVAFCIARRSSACGPGRFFSPWDAGLAGGAVLVGGTCGWRLADAAAAGGSVALAGAALLAAAGVEWLDGLPAERRGRGARGWLLAATAAPVVLGVGLIAIGTVYLYRSEALTACLEHAEGPGALAGAAAWAANLLETRATPPPFATAATWWACRMLPVLGAMVLVFGVRAAMGWDIRRLAMLTVLGMLGVLFVGRHLLSEAARTGDGEKAHSFARQVERRIGGDAFAACGMSQTPVEAYLGRLGVEARTIGQVRQAGAKWLIATDKSLLALSGPRTGPAPASGEFWIGRSALERAADPLGSLAWTDNAAMAAGALAGERMVLVRLNPPRAGP